MRFVERLAMEETKTFCNVVLIRYIAANSTIVFIKPSFAAEREAKDAISWLRAAGFPQYVQMYAGKFRAVHKNNS